ncbi:hypothetical protein AYK20_00150 [Thermoplasmatales archaeon SG8-52-1]|nr:MAG: hypothetical protein AYK20_00150 [Thermoplasmatales archaeon SG8-52-1]
MENIPLIKLKKRKVLGHNNSSFKNILEKFNENEKIYILDFDGIEKNKPNLCTFQRLSHSYNLWVDFAPRNLGDVVDAVMAGATAITLRKPHWPNIEITDIKDITENEIYTNIDFEYKGKYDFREAYKHQIDGFVNFYTKEKIESNFQDSDYLKTIGMKNKIYTYESDIKNISYWKGFNIKGVLVDFDKIKEFKNGF